VTDSQTSALQSDVAPTAVPHLWRNLLLSGFAIVLMGGAVLLIDSHRETPAAAMDAPVALPILAQVPDFSLTERSGRLVTLDDLLGSVWVADFIFTRCAGPCPKLSAKFRTIQRELEGRASIKLVSICLDPKNDTTFALATYAKRFSADPDRWWFLTGKSEKVVHELVGKGFLQSVVPASGNDPLMHSTYFVVIDRKGRIRSAYNGLLSSARERIMADIQTLLAESEPES